MNLSKGILALSIAMVSVGAQAELVQSNWKVENDNRLMLDTSTGLEWLKLNETLNYGKPSSAKNYLGEGKLFEGFRLATESEIEQMWKSMFEQVFADVADQINMYDPTQSDGTATTHSIFPNYSSQELQKSGTPIKQLLGKTLNIGYVVGTYYDADGNERMSGINLANGGASFWDNKSIPYFADWTGTYLVSDTGFDVSSRGDYTIDGELPGDEDKDFADVPAPLFLSLFAFAGLALRRRR